MEYILIKGIVDELRVTEGYEDLSPFQNIRNGAAAVGAMAAALESSISSSVLAGSRNSAEVKMNFFTCIIGEYLLKGKFYSVGFKNGDVMEFVASLSEGIYEVYCACSPSRQLIWTRPHQTRGHVAQHRSDFRKTVCFSLGFGIFFTLLWNFDLDATHKTQAYVTAFLLAFVMTFALGILICRQFYDYSYNATKIFEILGFADPDEIDLPKNHARAEKEYAEKNMTAISTSTPWQYRYNIFPDSDG